MVFFIRLTFDASFPSLPGAIPLVVCTSQSYLWVVVEIQNITFRPGMTWDDAPRSQIISHGVHFKMRGGYVVRFKLFLNF